jgi:GGDEF domain-containing protein
LILILPVTSLEGAQVKSDRLRAAVHARSWGGAPASRMTISLGGAAGIPQTQVGADRLLASSLEALHEAQARGGDSVIIRPWS